MVRPAAPPPREVRVSFSLRLHDAAVVHPDAPLPPPAVVAADPWAEDPPPPPPAPPPTDLWVTEIGAQLSADRKAIEAVLGSIRGAADGLKEQHAARLGEWRTAAVEMGVSIAAKLLHERVSSGEFAVEEIVRGMAADLHDEVLSVRLNPRDLELLEKRLDGQPLLSDAADPRLIADPQLARGECRMEAKSAVSVSDLPRQLADVRDDLLRRIARAGA